MSIGHVCLTNLIKGMRGEVTIQTMWTESGEDWLFKRKLRHYCQKVAVRRLGG